MKIKFSTSSSFSKKLKSYDFFRTWIKRNSNGSIFEGSKVIMENDNFIRELDLQYSFIDFENYSYSDCKKECNCYNQDLLDEF